MRYLSSPEAIRGCPVREDWAISLEEEILIGQNPRKRIGNDSYAVMKVRSELSRSHGMAFQTLVGQELILFALQVFTESLILAQNERWRRG